MSKRFMMIASAFVFGLMAISACEKRNEKTPDNKSEEKEENTVSSEDKKNEFNLEVKDYMVNAKKFDRWVYFSFEKGDTLSITDPQNSNDWDLAFSRLYVKSNGGTSGEKGISAIETPFKKFSELTYETLGMGTSYESDKVMPFIYSPVDGLTKDESYNDVLSRGIYAKMNGQMPPPILFSGRIYFIKFTDGKMATIKFTGYEYQTVDYLPAERGYVSFSYQYPIKK